MADKSAIEWTDATWNPIVGCSIVSPGCTHCYAMGMAARIEAMTAALTRTGQGGAPHYDGTTKKVKGTAIWTGKVALAPDHILTQPLAWRAPRKIFVNSMGDLFHEDVPDAWIDQVFAVGALCPQHTLQILTKRAARMRSYLTDPATVRRVYTLVCDMTVELEPGVVLIAEPEHEQHAPPGPRVYLDQWPLPNVWLGVSAERQQEADERIPELLATPAAIRFVSAEPLLGPIDFYKTSGSMPHEGHPWRDGPILQGIHWIIAGGESGPSARPMHPAWVRSLRDQCRTAGTAFFFKQWGAWAPATDAWQHETISVLPDGRVREWESGEGRLVDPHMTAMSRLGKKDAGRLLDGVEHNALPAA